MKRHLNAFRAGIGAVIAAMGLATTASAQVLLDNSSPTYTQNFDTLPTATTAWADNSTLANWYAKNFSGTIPAGGNIVAGDGTSTSGALYTLGTTAASDRALGSQGSGTPGAHGFGVRIKNNDATRTITSLAISFTGEQWRVANVTTPPDKLHFFYQVSASPITGADAGGGSLTASTAPVAPWISDTTFDFGAPVTFSWTAAALDGNAAANRTAITSSLGVTVAPGSEIFLEWWDANDAGSDEALGVDDLTITGTFVLGVDYAVSPTSHGFGSKDFDNGPVTDNSVTITATNSTTINGVVASGADGALFSVTSPSIPFTVNPGSPQAVTIQFAPTANDGISRSGTLTFSTPQNPPTFDVNLTGASPLATTLANVKAVSEGGTSNSNGYKFSAFVGSTTTSNNTRNQVAVEDAVSGNVATRGLVLDDPTAVGGPVTLGDTINVVGTVEPSGFRGLMEFMPSNLYAITASGSIVNPVVTSNATDMADATEGVVLELDSIFIPVGTYDTVSGSVGIVIPGAADSTGCHDSLGNPFQIEIMAPTFINYTSDGSLINLRGIGWQFTSSGNPLTGGDGYEIRPRSNADFMAIVQPPAAAGKWMMYE